MAADSVELRQSSVARLVNNVLRPSQSFGMRNTAVRLAALLSVVVGLLLGAVLSYTPSATAARNSSGTHSLPSGNPVTSGTAITATWANNTLSDLSTEITNSLDRNGRGAMLAPLQLPSGTAGAPSLTFSSDSDSGLYRAGAGDVRMSVNSTYLQQWTDSLVTIPVGLTVTETTSNASAITATGNGTGPGVTGLGGSSNGDGVVGTASGTGDGVEGTAASSGAGVKGTNSSTGPGVLASNSGAGVALEVGAGNVKFSGSNPTSTTGFSNTLTPLNVPKAWVRFTSGASPTTLAGFNVASVSCGSSTCTVTFATALSSANYAVLTNVDGAPTLTYAGSLGTGSFNISAYDCGVDPCASLNPTTSTRTINVVVFGAQ